MDSVVSGSGTIDIHGLSDRFSSFSSWNLAFHKIIYFLFNVYTVYITSRHLYPFVCIEASLSFCLSAVFGCVCRIFNFLYFFSSIFEFINPFCGYGALSWAAKPQGFRPHLWVVAHFLRFNRTVNPITHPWEFLVFDSRCVCTRRIQILRSMHRHRQTIE